MSEFGVYNPMQPVPSVGAGSCPDGATERNGRGRLAPGNPHRWTPGQSGNPGGRPRGTSFAAALARQAVAPVSDREEMVKIARTIGLDPEDVRHIDVVAALFYVVLCRLLVRASGGNGRVDERLLGMLQVLLRALDPAELRVSGPDGGPIPIAAVVANVQTALGMRPAEITKTGWAGHTIGAEDSEDASALPPPDTWQRLLEAAEALLDAPANQMVTAEEWRALRDAAIACRPDAAAPDAVPPSYECPQYHEWHPDLLVWRDDKTVVCQTCGKVYEPTDSSGTEPAGQPEGGDDAGHA